MDAATDVREVEKVQLLARLAELMVEEQRELGRFQRTPHLCELENVSLDLAKRLGCVSLARAVAETAAECGTEVSCPSCGRACRVETAKRTMTSLSGPVELLEPTAHCPACRRDFFPSA